MQRNEVHVLVSTAQFMLEHDLRSSTAGLLIIDDEHKVFDYYRHELRSAYLSLVPSCLCVLCFSCLLFF